MAVTLVLLGVAVGRRQVRVRPRVGACSPSSINLLVAVVGQAHHHFATGPASHRVLNTLVEPGAVVAAVIFGGCVLEVDAGSPTTAVGSHVTVGHERRLSTVAIGVNLVHTVCSEAQLTPSFAGVGNCTCTSTVVTDLPGWTLGSAASAIVGVFLGVDTLVSAQGLVVSTYFEANLVVTNFCTGTLFPASSAVVRVIAGVHTLTATHRQARLTGNGTSTASANLSGRTFGCTLATVATIGVGIHTLTTTQCLTGGA